MSARARAGSSGADAASWVARLQAPACTTADWREFLLWLGGAANREREYEATLRAHRLAAQCECDPCLRLAAQRALRSSKRR